MRINKPLLLTILLAGTWLNAATLPKPSEFPTIESLQSLRSSFNADHDSVRLVALLSPSCGYCVKGYRYMQKLLEEIDDPRLKMEVVWLPMLSGDSQSLAAKLSSRSRDERLSYQAWDPGRHSGRAWQQRLGLGGVAWDVYFLYESGRRWDEELPPSPDYWQHQGAGGAENWLHYSTLKQRLLAALARADREAVR